MRKRSNEGTAFPPDRRQLLKLLGGGLAAGLGLPVACGRTLEGEATLVELASIPLNGTLRVLHGELPIELRRTAEGDVTGRSLWCTHMGCEVKWHGDRDVYICPCHDGVFTADGTPLAGPPVKALREVPVRVRGSEVLIGLPPEGSHS